MITPEWLLLLLGGIALVVALPMAMPAIARRGTGERYESVFWVQRAPQLAVAINVALIVLDSASGPESGLSLFAYLPAPLAAVLRWLGVALYASGLVFWLGGWSSLGANLSTDSEILRDQTLTTGGFYRFVLHPAYSGVLQALVGAELVTGSLLGMAFTVVFVGPLGLRRAEYEESLLLERFGAEYERHAASVGWRRVIPSFLPFGF